MKNQFTICVLLLVPTLVLAQETTIETFSYSEFFELIEKETDTIFRLKDALVIYNPKTDQRFRVPGNPNERRDKAYRYLNDIVVEKHLELNNRLEGL